MVNYCKFYHIVLQYTFITVKKNNKKSLNYLKKISHEVKSSESSDTVKRLFNLVYLSALHRIPISNPFLKCKHKTHRSIKQKWIVYTISCEQGFHNCCNIVLRLYSMWHSNLCSWVEAKYSLAEITSVLYHWSHVLYWQDRVIYRLASD